jgi:PAS domain S-box-containing protein
MSQRSTRSPGGPDTRLRSCSRSRGDENRVASAVDRRVASLARHWKRQSDPRSATRDLPHYARRRLSRVLHSLKISAAALRDLESRMRLLQRAQQELRRQMEHFALGQRISRTGSWTWNASSGELFCSREHFRIFGLEAEGKPASYRAFFRMIHADERARLEREFRKAVTAALDFDSEYRIVRPDGTVRHLRTCACPVFGESGDLTEYVGTVEDITERRHGEESIGRMQAELARVSRAITLGQLMATIAHEVNQPLAALVVNAAAALRWLRLTPPRVDKARQALTRIARDGNRASDIIARIRALVGKRSVERRPLNLNLAFQEVTVLVRTELRRHNITLRTDFNAQLPLLSCDRVQIQQVILNLLMNAIESLSAVPKRSRLLDIQTAADGVGVIATVKDNGKGLEERSLERVFEPFYTTKAGGVGIGLAISRSIIESHGGRIWAARNRGFGAKFQFQLPLNGAYAE